MATGLTERKRTSARDEPESDKGGSRRVAVPSRAPYLWMLCGSVAFALMGTLAHGVAADCDWQVVAFVRSFLAFLFAAILTRAAGAQFTFVRPPVLWVRSLAGSVSLVSTFYAFSRMPQSEVLTITNIFPLWIALLCWPLYGRRPGGGLLLALGCGLAGVVLIQQPLFAEGNLGAATALLASMATAVSMLGLNRLGGLDPRAIVTHFSGVSCVACVASYFVFDNQHGLAMPEPRALCMLAGVGICATVGQLFLTKAFAAGPPTRVALVGLSQIPLAMLFDVVFWGHGFGAATLVGTVLVLGPTAWVMASREGAAASHA
jgi:drug/metabolite transporter (DMT)-like permease